MSELLPWPHNEIDAGLVSQIADSELDERMHFYWDTEEEDEVSCTFRREIERRMEQGETEPNTFYDQMCLIPDTPSYGVHA